MSPPPESRSAFVKHHHHHTAWLGCVGPACCAGCSLFVFAPVACVIVTLAASIALQAISLAFW
jgi:hypothetical protein